MSRKQSSTPAFTLVYSSSKKASALHALTEKECWSGHMRPATADELRELAGKHCKHCASRLAKAPQEPAKPAPKPKREPIARHEPAEQPQAAERVQVIA